MRDTSAVDNGVEDTRRSFHGIDTKSGSFVRRSRTSPPGDERREWLLGFVERDDASALGGPSHPHAGGDYRTLKDEMTLMNV